MDALILLIPLSLLLGGIALAAFLWTMRSGQYDDLDAAAHRILFDDDRNDTGQAQPNRASEKETQS